VGNTYMGETRAQLCGSLEVIDDEWDGSARHPPSSADVVGQRKRDMYIETRIIAPSTCLTLFLRTPCRCVVLTTTEANMTCQCRMQL